MAEPNTTTDEEHTTTVEFNGIKRDYILTPVEEVPRGIIVNVARGPFDSTGVLRLVGPKHKGDSIDLGGYKVELDDPIKVHEVVDEVTFSGVKEIEVENAVGEEIFDSFGLDGLTGIRDEFWKAKVNQKLSTYTEDEEFIEDIEKAVEWANAQNSNST